MKMPVGQTLEGAFGFAVKSFLSVLGTVWFPYLVAAAIIGGAIYLMHPDWNSVLNPTDSGPMALAAQLGRFGHIFTLGWLVLLVTGAMVRVGLMRKALGLHEGPVFIFYSLGAPVWRMVAAFFLLGLIWIGIVIASIAACAAAIGLSGTFLQQPWRGVADTVAVIVVLLAAIYAVMRFYFFLPAVVVAEKRIGLGRAWELGKGNVLRSVVVLLAIGISVSIVFNILLSFAVPFGSFPNFGAHVAPQDIMRWQLNLFRTAGPPILAIFVLQSIVMEALFAGAMATAYRAVTPDTLPGTEGSHS